MRIPFSILVFTFLFSFIKSNSQTAAVTNYDSLRIVLEDIVERDQNIRRILVDSIGFDSPDAGPHLKKMKDIDNENQKKIIVILDKYGWIEKSKIGTKASEAFFYTIQHSDASLMMKWFPHFKKLADIGEADKVECAMMEDRLLMWQGKKQIYGTQATSFGADKKMRIWPIEDAKNVNKRRKKIGFEQTVEENAIRLHAIYNANEQLPVNIK